MNPRLQKPRRTENRKLLAEIRSLPCVVCGRKADAAHIKSKGSGGPDVDWNLLPLCRNHHIEQHRKGWIDFTFKYTGASFALKLRGWVVEGGKLRHPKLNRQDADTDEGSPV